MSKSYRTAKGRMLNMEELRAANEMKVAAGNAQLNARGDKLGPGGSIAERVADRARQNSHSQATRRVSIKPPIARTVHATEPDAKPAQPVSEATATEVAYQEEMDEDGNIVVKKVPEVKKTRSRKGGSSETSSTKG